MTHQHDSISDHYDVVVVGARAAGASTAMLLARRGLRVLAVDRGASGSDTLSTHSIATAGVLQLSRWGLLDTIREAGTPVADRVVFHFGDDVVDLAVTARGDVDGLYSPRRTLLDSVLVDGAVAAGADVRHGVSFISVTTAGDGRVNGVEIDVDGRRRTIGARLVVGADGVRSRVARQVGAQVIHQEPAGAACIYGYLPGLPDDTIVNRYDDQRGVGIIPTNDGLANVWVSMPLERYERTARGRHAEAYVDDLATIPELAHLTDLSPAGGLKAFLGMPGFLRQGWGPGWALVGDAAYFKDPLSAHGITDAFIGAELVADAAADALCAGTDEAEAFGAAMAVRDELAGGLMPPVATAVSYPSDMTTMKFAFRDMSRAMRSEWEYIEEHFAAAVA